MESETIILEITDLSTDGRGVGHHESRAYFVDRTLPGDVVRAKLNRAAWPFSAMVIQFLTPSSQRCVHPCPHSADCPGSLWGALEYPEQLRYKRNLVERTLSRQIGPAEVLPMLASPKIWHYRNRINLTIWREEAHLIAGFQQGPRSDAGVPIRTCALCEESIAEKIPGVVNRLWEIMIPEGTAFPRRLLLFETLAGAGMMLVFPTNLTTTDISEWKQRLGNLDLPGGIWLATGTRAGILHEHSEFHQLPNALPMSTTWFDRPVELHPSLFCQANSGAANHAALKIREWSRDHRWTRVWDLYGGFGGLGMAAAYDDIPVDVFELTARAETTMRRLAENLQLSRVNFVAGDLWRRFPQTIRKISERDVILLDPPRSGAHPHLLEMIGRSRAASLIYLSCNPARLARDLGLLLPFGFKPLIIQPLDFFPQTPAIETLCLLQR